MTTIRIEKRAIQLPGRPRLGDPDCTTNPTDCCGFGQSLDGVSLVVEKRRWTLPRGATVGETWCEDFETCCESGSGSGGDDPVQDCCPYQMPSTLTCLVSDGGTVQNLTATWNGSYWITPDGAIRYALRCTGTTWEIGISCPGSGSVLEWVTADGRCDPNFFQGFTFSGGEITCASSGLSVSFLGSSGGGAGSNGDGTTFRLRIQKTRVYLPDAATIGDPKCIDGPDDCCEDRITPPCCPTSSIGEVVYAAFRNVGGGCAELEGVVVPMVYSTSVWTGSVAYKMQYPGDDANSILYCCVTCSLLCNDDGTLLFTVSFELYSRSVIGDIPSLEDLVCGVGAGGGSLDCTTDVDQNVFPCPTGLLYQEFNGRSLSYQGTCLSTNICCDPVTFDVVLFE